MKPFLIVSISLIVFLAACQEKESYNIVCEIEGIELDSALIGFNPQSNRDIQIRDTVVFRNGRLTYQFDANELCEAQIIPFSLFHHFDDGEIYPLPASRIEFYIDSLDFIQINGLVEDQCVDYEVKGNKLSEELSIARKMRIPLYKERIPFEYEYHSKSNSERTKADEEKYQKNRNINDAKYQDQLVSFIEKYPDSEYAPRTLLGIPDRQVAQECFELLTPHARDSYFGKIAVDRINGWYLTTAGLKFPDLNAKGIDGKNLNISDYMGKYVLIDFWGSWCGPCINEMPALLELSEKFNDDLQLIGIACNDNLEKLEKAVGDLGITWPQILEGTTRETKYAQKFGVTAFPTKILLDRKGIVVKSYFNNPDENISSDLERLIYN